MQKVLLLATFLLASTAMEVPSLPDAFSSNVNVTMPFFGVVPGKIYFDYSQLSYRVDTTSFGMTQIDIYRYDIENPSQFTISGGQCQVQPLEGELYPMAVPPFANYNGMTNVDGVDVQFWEINWFGAADIQYYIGNYTDSNGKMEFYTVKFDFNTQGIDLAFEFSRPATAGPQDPSLFDPTQFGCPSPQPPVTFTVQGYVKSAVDNSIIKGATITLGSQSTTSDSNGQYSFSKVPEGLTKIIFSANGYFTLQKQLDVSRDIGYGTGADANLSPKLQPGQMRAVLTWGSYPLDLDSYSTSPWGCTVYYRNRACSSGQSGVLLDVDARNGYGPETITYTSVSSGTYHYYVNIYSAGTFYNSTAKVLVYDQNGLNSEVMVPTSGFPGSYRYWKVFSVNGGVISVVNEVSSAPWS